MQKHTADRFFGFNFGTALESWRQGWSEVARWPVFERVCPDEPVRVVRTDDTEVIILRGRQCRANVGAEANTVALELPGQLVLQREVVLPALADADIERALAIEVADTGPFPADVTVWGWRRACIAESDRETGHVTVLLAIASRTHIEPLLRPLSERLSDSNPEVWVGVEQPIILQGFGEGARASRNRSRTRRLYLLMSTAVFLAGFLLLSPLLAERQRVFSAQASLQVLQQDAAPVVALREQLVASSARLTLMRADFAQRVDLAVLIEALTQLLPDDVVLTQIEAQRGGSVRISGDALNASKVTEILGRHSAFADVRSPAPTRRNPQSGKESFVIEFSVQQEQQPG